MSPLRIRVDWEELEDAFADGSGDHRYYLDRETGAVHFFSSYLENGQEDEDERAMTAGDRYVLVPHASHLASLDEIWEFAASIGLRLREGGFKLEQALAEDPQALDEWRRFVKERIGPRIKSWLEGVSVEPLE
jgi:hypothetical protein